jgi:hypothetical protein
MATSRWKRTWCLHAVIPEDERFSGFNIRPGFDTTAVLSTAKLALAMK